MPSRRLPLLLGAVTAILVSVLSAPAEATGVADEPDASAVALDALDDVRDIFSGEEVAGPAPTPQDLPADPVADDATLALRDLAVLRSELSGADLVEANSYLARPTDPSGPSNPDRSYSVAEAPPACAGSVCVHYVTSSNDAPSLTDNNPVNGVPDYIDIVLKTATHVHDTYLAAGYRAPKGDGTRGGGTDKTDIYVADIGGDGLYGYCTSDQKIPSRGPFDAWAYCVVDDDYSSDQFRSNTALENLQVTIAHEYFHAVQFSYDFLEDSWFLEATAAWVEDEIYDNVNDNLQYLRVSPLRLPRVPMDTFGGGFHYGTWIFFRYLSELLPASKGGLPTVVRDMVRKTDGSAGARDLYSIQAVKAVLKQRGKRLPKLFAEFSAGNRRPALTYSEGRANRYRSAPLVKRYAMGRRHTRSGNVRIDHLTSATVRFSPSKKLTSRKVKLRFQLQMARANRGSAAVASIKLRSGKTRVVQIPIQRSGRGARALPFSVRKVKYIELTLANAGTNYACFDGPYSCRGSSKNDGVVEKYRATVLGG